MADTHPIQCPRQGPPDPQQCPRMTHTMRQHIPHELVQWWSMIWTVQWIHSFKIQWAVKNSIILSPHPFAANNHPHPCYQPFLPPTQVTHPPPTPQIPYNQIDQWTSKIYNMKGDFIRSQQYVLSSPITSELKIVRPDQIIRPSLNKIVWRWTDQFIKSEDQTHTNTHTYKRSIICSL